MSRSRKGHARRGLTLAELLVATTIMLMIATAVATLAATVHSTNSFCHGHTVAAQHGRVALSRIQRTVESAIASEYRPGDNVDQQFPGVLVVSEQVAGQELPYTLVVWRPGPLDGPTLAPGNRRGLPLINELVVYAPNPLRPNELLEIRSLDDTGVVPPPNDMSAWRTLTDQLKTSGSTTKVVLTTRLRTTPLSGSYSDSLSPSDLRGAIRFRRLMAPSHLAWSQYRSGTKTWHDLDWPLGSYRMSSGTRIVACQTELQIAPDEMATAAVTAIPFFGSASISYELPR
jgi:prepilin-type N-terminal cleavage/methylation domain-containing protein